MPGPIQLEEWICVMDREGNPGCGFTLVMGVTMQGIPQRCPKCGGRAWDIRGDAKFCRVTKAAHVWRKGADREGLPHMDPDQVCEACGVIPVMEGVGN